MQGEMNFDDPIEDMDSDDAKDTLSCRRCGTELIPKVNWTGWAYEKKRYICRECKSEERKELANSYYAKHSDPNYVWDPEFKLECTKCKEVKTAEGNFFRNLHAKSGYKSSCKKCLQTWKFKYTDLKRGARLRNYEWSLEEQDTSGLLLSDCYYCGKPSVEGLKMHGLDRIDNSKGYHIDNVVPCCEQCNRAKLSDTKEDFIEMCKRVADKHSTYEKSNMESIKIYLENKDLGEFMKENFDYPVW